MNGIHSSPYRTYENGAWTPIDGNVTEEAQVCLHVNGQEIATLMCTPRDLDELALGFLRAEGIIQSSAEVEVLTIAAHQTCVDVWLKKNISFEPPKRHIRTSGCGGGVTFDDMKGQRPPLEWMTAIQPEQIFARMHELYQAAELYEATQGIHTAALADNEQILLVAEDIGRHNAVDRIWGKAMKQNIPTAGRILLSTGRISSEMLNKAAKMEVPIVASRTSPTSLSVTLAEAWNITLIGYVRRNTLRVYAGPERFQ